MNINVESRMLDIKGYTKTTSEVVPVKMNVVIESVGEEVSYIHTPDKNLELVEKTPESVIIIGKCTYYIPDYIKEIINNVAKGLGRHICITDTIIHKCIVSELALTKEQMLELLDTIIEAVEKKQPEIR
jgi:hypothetical protein